MQTHKKTRVTNYAITLYEQQPLFLEEPMHAFEFDVADLHLHAHVGAPLERTTLPVDAWWSQEHHDDGAVHAHRGCSRRLG